MIRKPDTKPFAVPVARRVPITFMEKVEKELQRMKDGDIIEEINEPCDWVSPMVPVIKPSGEVKICVDLKKLNEKRGASCLQWMSIERLQSVLKVGCRCRVSSNTS